MVVSEVIVIGVALAMDAFGVTLGVGINRNIKNIDKQKYIISFAFFQFLLAFIGGISGYFFNNYIFPISSVVGGVVIGIVGILIIIDGLKKSDESILAKKAAIIILGISVSIDAMVIGFTIFNDIQKIFILFVYTILIGLITLLICTIGLFISGYISRINFVKKYASLFGGFSLILFSIKMIFF
ncbi:manganese efflux pump [Clostridium sp. SHJSY1]|uniref:manganese efflux pump n=1 Tax=Clostridium sp. SHJSY1 TaxID=2942483 RepID=UPI002875D6EA|nr:manganese efflux pump [Clostridium sp. SHJSY1]MDS0524160.1 manganese efflux pump [Clostridium sp. SHJSY1]